MQFSDYATYVAFNGRVFAVDRRDGAVLWRWKAPKGDFVTLLPDGDQLLVCSDGYLWALRSQDGTLVWSQPFKGEGTGIPFLASPRSNSETQTTAAMAVLAAAAERKRQQQSSSSQTAATS
jgi:outer membrane protein assembly factor BamB